MAIKVEVKPDFSAFRNVTAEQIVAEVGCSEQVAEAIVERFIVLPG